MRSLIEAYSHIMTPVFMVSPRDGVIHLANSSAAKICGYRVDDLKGMKFHAFFQEKDQKRILEMLEAGEDVGIYSEFNLKIVRKSGREVVVNLTGRRVLVDKQDYAVFTLNDITLLQKSHEELELRVQERTADLHESRNRIKTILDSSLQGFLTINQSMVIEPEYSVKTAAFLGDDILGKNIVDVLSLNRSMFENFCVLTFQNQSWDVVKQFATMELKIREKILKIEFVPVIEDNVVKRILGTLTDITPMKVLEQRAEKTAREGRSLFKVLQSKPIFLHVMHSLYEDSEVPDPKDEKLSKRYVHTIKGECAFFELKDIVEICEDWEEKWLGAYQSSDLAVFLTQVREKLKEFINKYDKVLKLTVSDETFLNVPISGIKTLVRNTLDYPLETQFLHSFLKSTENILEQTPEDCLAWLGETWLMVAASLGKKVEPLQWNASCRIFYEPYKKLLSTLVHAVRNAVDHGIELPLERKTAGKPEKGSMIVELKFQDPFYHFRFKDDGKGIILEKVLEKARTMGLAIPEDKQEILQLIFKDGFSTKESPNAISGNGVGLSAVRAEAEVLGGGARVCNLPQAGMELHVWFKKIPLEQFIH